MIHVNKQVMAATFLYLFLLPLCLLSTEDILTFPKNSFYFLGLRGLSDLKTFIYTQ